MQRSTLDKLVSAVGLVLAAILAVAGGLLTYANAYIGDQVRAQLRGLDLTMPSGEVLDDERLRPHLARYAGQQLTTGDQAYVYAEHYLRVQMTDVANGQSYEDLTNQYIELEQTIDAEETAGNSVSADQAAQLHELGEMRQAIFRARTTQGLLLSSYTFWTMGRIAGYAAIAAFIGSVLLLALGLLGIRHAQQAQGEV